RGGPDGRGAGPLRPRRARGDAGSAGAQRRSVTRRAVKLPLYYIFARSRRENANGCRRSLQPGGDGTEDWWTLLARFDTPREKPRWPPRDNDAEFAGVITHADSGVDQLPHGLPAQLRPPPRPLASILFPRRFRA